jgi:two-component system cell cycle sensor histidine kinase/response regulator CckA
MSPVVLVVDDDPDLRELVCCALEAVGHRVTAVGDADTALAHPAVASGQVGLLLTDVDLPGQSGLELADRFAAAGVQVLVMTGHGASAVAGLPARVQVLDKPFSIPALRARVRAALDA